MPSATNGYASSHRQVEPLDLRAAWIAEVDRAAARRRWGQALLALGAIHLIGALWLQTLVWTTGGRPHWPYPITWLVELGVVLATMRWICGAGWLREPGMPAVVARVWGTFFILSFNLAASNDLYGWDVDWFKSAWCTLGTFGWATMAWLFSLRFLVPAVGFYFTGLLIVAFPRESYLIHGVAWGVTLVGVGNWLERRRQGEGAGFAREWLTRARPNSVVGRSVAATRVD